MAEIEQVDAKYVFIDVVAFTSGRSVEAQSDIVSTLNEIVSTTLQEFRVATGQRILLPTGDGICVALLGAGFSYDVHIQIATCILEKVKEHNDATRDEMRRFELRVGVNANVDNLVTDINGNRNTAGAGINIAQRVMDMADGKQILVSHSVYDTLRQREKYMGAFRGYVATLKHGEQAHVYQLMMNGNAGLSIEVPYLFRKPKKKPQRLTKEVAYYIAHALANEQALRENRDRIYNDYAVIVIFSLLARDSVDRSEASEFDMLITSTYRAESFWETYEYYRKQDTEVCRLAAETIQELLLEYSACFVQDYLGLADFRAVSDKGRRRLKEEWPSIWKEFGFDEQEDKSE